MPDKGTTSSPVSRGAAGTTRGDAAHGRSHKIRFRVECADALAFPADVLVLKYAQALHGVDAAVSKRLDAQNIAVAFPGPKAAELIEALAGIH